MTIQCLFCDSQAARDSQSRGNSVFQRVFRGLSFLPSRLRPIHHNPTLHHPPNLLHHDAKLRRRITHHAAKSAKYPGATAPKFSKRFVIPLVAELVLDHEAAGAEGGEAVVQGNDPMME
jgi:hypothetical protein